METTTKLDADPDGELNQPSVVFRSRGRSANALAMKTTEFIAQELASNRMTPLRFLLKEMRAYKTPKETKIEIAMFLAPYFHSKAPVLPSPPALDPTIIQAEKVTFADFVPLRLRQTTDASKNPENKGN